VRVQAESGHQAYFGMVHLGINLQPFDCNCLIRNNFNHTTLCQRGIIMPCARLRLSVSSLSSTKTAEHKITQAKPHDFDRSLPYGGAKCRLGWLQSANFDK